jgi:hypothetical protein
VKSVTSERDSIGLLVAHHWRLPGLQSKYSLAIAQLRMDWLTNAAQVPLTSSNRPPSAPVVRNNQSP